jgi:predicted transcriptional regulator
VTEETSSKPLAELVAQLATAYVTANRVTIEEISKVVEVAHAALSKVKQADAAPSAPVAAEEPVGAAKLTAAQWKRLIKDDGIVSLVDNRSYKTLRRHLTTHGLTPKEYREKYGLPADFPMVSPSYSKARSELAKQLGLGARRQQAAKAAAVPPPEARGSASAPRASKRTSSRIRPGASKARSSAK